MVFPTRATSQPDIPLEIPDGYKFFREIRGDLTGDGVEEIVIGLELKDLFDWDHSTLTYIYQVNEGKWQKIATLSTGGAVFGNHGLDYSRQDHTFVIGDVNQDAQNDLLVMTYSQGASNSGTYLLIYTAESGNSDIRFREIFAQGFLLQGGVKIDDFLSSKQGKEILTWDGIEEVGRDKKGREYFYYDQFQISLYVWDGQEYKCW
ncbi:hypothetical protein HYU72_02530, partial [Candidatus Berkelbacteria bacterium]|nr:hypothetical protein [Candidatus Berkelbacteria bacterium]